MIELPEAATIARQMTETLRGKRVATATRGNSPHKFAFYTRSPEEYASLLAGGTMGEAREYGSCLVAEVDPYLALVLGGGGERILYHEDGSTLPKKHQLLLQFADDTYLSVSVQGWGSVKLLRRDEIAADPYLGPERVSPLEPAFTGDYFQSLFAQLPEGDGRAIKFFFISEPGIWGVGNGYLQDILYRARVHPRRKALETTADERTALYQATVDILRSATDLGGRDTERDLFNQAGGYVRLMDRRTAGQPCPACKTPVEKISFLGGACYLCPRCQR